MRITSKAQKQWNKIPRKDRDAIKSKLTNFEATGEGDIKKLTGTSNEYRLRHGQWRAVFIFEGDVLVIRIMHRKDVYR